MYIVFLRDEAGMVTKKEFKDLKKAEEFYYTTQLEFKYIEMKLVSESEVIDHCYLQDSKLKPIWLD